MELIWLKLKSELNRLEDTVQRDQRELKISERKERNAWGREVSRMKWEARVRVQDITHVKGKDCRNCYSLCDFLLIRA